MKFAVCTNKPAAKTQVAPITPQDITEAYEGMMTAYMELTDAQRNLDEVCQVMENINLSMLMIQKGGIEAVKLLNIDKSIESLISVAEEKLTVENAQEGLDGAASAAWEKLKEWVKKIIEAVKKFLNYLGDKMKALLDHLNVYKKAYQAGVAEGKAEYSKEFINFVLPEGSLVLLHGFVETHLHEISKLVADLAKFADIVYNKKNLDDPELNTFGEKLNGSSVFDMMKDGRVALKCDGKVDTLAKAGYSSADQVFDETDRLGEFIRKNSAIIGAATDKLAAIYTTFKNENPDSTATKNVRHAGICCGHTTECLRSLVYVHASTLNALGIIIGALKEKFNIGK